MVFLHNEFNYQEYVASNKTKQNWTRSENLRTSQTKNDILFSVRTASFWIYNYYFSEG